MLLGAGGGAHLHPTARAGDGRAVFVLAGGLRARVWRVVVAEALAQQGARVGGAYLTGRRCSPQPAGDPDGSCRYDVVAPKHDDGPTTFVVRTGVELRPPPGGAAFRLTAGTGTALDVGGALGTAAAGVTFNDGRHVRLTLDAERWWYRMPFTTYERSARGTVTLVARGRTPATTTVLRLGLELPTGLLRAP